MSEEIQGLDNIIEFESLQVDKPANLEEFYENLTQEVISESQSRDLIRQQAFFEIINEDLIDNGELTPNYDYAFYQKTGVEISGFGYDENRRILSLMVSEYFNEDQVETLTKGTIDAKFKRLRKFLDMVAKDQYEDIVKNEVYDMAYNIKGYIRAEMVDKFRFFLITNGKATRNLKFIENDKIGDIDIEFRVIDLEYIYSNYLSDSSGVEIEIHTELPCLEIDSSNNEYSSYLASISGDQIVELYEDYGQRLFEQNVRTFLQFRSNVNKGLKNTIKQEPERFFAYNNGITATASEVDIENGKITRLKGLQIVNGGQTTSSIYSCHKKDKLSVDKITVQMKLSVINDKEKHSDFVNRVSRYANTQNKVNEADFFSNNPFHQEFKSYSNRVWAPAVDGGQQKTYWYYERVRGEYLNDQAYLTEAKKRQFKITHPPDKKIEKTFISKSEISWLQQPDIVAKGVSYSFRKFAETVTSQIEKDNLSITEEYYKHVIARVIMFKSLEKMISAADWYENAFRAQTVTYSMAYLSYIISNIKKHFDFDAIWVRQALPYDVELIFQEITYAVYQSINNPGAGYANVAQWCKKKECWTKVKEDLNITVDNNASFLIGKSIVATKKKEEKVKKKFESAVEKWKFVLDRKNRKIWEPLLQYCNDDNINLSNKQRDILTKFSTGLLPMPSDKQSVIIFDIYKEALDQGWMPQS